MSGAAGPSRRLLLAGAIAACATCADAAAPGAPRLAAIDWAALETLLAIGAVPVAAAELVLYRSVVVEPPLPAAVADIGLRGSPSYEALWLARPDLILSSDYYAWAEPKLSLIAPVERISIYVRGRRPYAEAVAETRRIAALAGRGEAAERYITQVDDALALARRKLTTRADWPAIVINFGDARHFRVFGADSMFGEVLARLGLRNAWAAGTSYSASAPIGLEALAGIDDAWIVVVPPTPPGTLEGLAGSAFWSALPAVRAGRVRIIEPVNPFGALPAALRFGRLVTDALAAPRADGGLG